MNAPLAAAPPAARAGRPADPRRVVVLHSAVAADAPADERDTLVQVEAVRAVLEQRGLAVSTLALTRDVAGCVQRLVELDPRCVFNLVESVDGRGDAIHLAPVLLDALRLRYTGCDARAMLLSADKRSAKRLMAGAGIDTPELFEGARPGRGPWIVKSVWEDASIGLDAGSIVEGAAACAREIEARARRFGGEWFAERFIDGREFNVAVIETPAGPRVLPVAEMCFVDFPADLPRIVDYAAKWDDRSFGYCHTVRRFQLPASDLPLVAALGRLALRCWMVFSLRGYARVDVRVDAQGRPFVIEVNANPCLAPDAGLAAAAARAGMDYPDLVGAVLDAAAADLIRVAGDPSGALR